MDFRPGVASSVRLDSHPVSFLFLRLHPPAPHTWVPQFAGGVISYRGAILRCWFISATYWGDWIFVEGYCWVCEGDFRKHCTTLPDRCKMKHPGVPLEGDAWWNRHTGLWGVIFWRSQGIDTLCKVETRILSILQVVPGSGGAKKHKELKRCRLIKMQTSAKKATPFFRPSSWSFVTWWTKKKKKKTKKKTLINHQKRQNHLRVPTSYLAEWGRWVPVFFKCVW